MQGSFLETMTLADWLFVGVLDAFAFLYCWQLGRESARSSPPLAKPPRT